jgi:hypothetical protein
VVLLRADTEPGITTPIPGDDAFYYEYVTGTDVPTKPWARADERTVE